MKTEFFVPSTGHQNCFEKSLGHGSCFSGLAWSVQREVVSMVCGASWNRV